MSKVELTELDAMYYVSFTGRTVDKADFADELGEGFEGFLLHIGPGYVKLTVAVVAESADAALDTAEEWLRSDKPDELTEEGNMHDEVYIESITR